MAILDKARELASSGTNASILAAAKQSGPVTATKAEVKTALEALADHLRLNRHQDAVATTLALLLWDADAAVARIRREGLWRGSRYKFRCAAALKCVEAAIGLLPELQLRPDRQTYLRSVRELLLAAPHLRKVRDSLVSRLKSRQPRALKTLLFAVNEVFANNWQGDWFQDSSTFPHWGSEDVAQAVSYMLHLVRDEIGMRPKLWQHVDDHFVGRHENVYVSMLIDAAKLNEFREVELLVDAMPYEAVREGNLLRVFSSDENLEKSIQLGYIQSILQDHIRAQGVAAEYGKAEESPTMEELVARVFKAGMHELVELKTEPIERLVYKAIIHKPFFAPFTSDAFLLDEAGGVLGIGIDAFRPDEAPSLKVSPGLTVMDVIKVQRWFRFMHAMYMNKLETFPDEEYRNALRMRSVILLVPQAALQELLQHVLEPAKAAEAIELLTLEESAEAFIDLQYKPFIKAGGHFILAPALIARSNLARNIVTANQMRKLFIGEVDPMEQAVVQALADAGFNVKANFEYDMGGSRETDVLCWRDGHLFVFECKNPYHPCSAHELCTSYGHIKTAKDQLDVRLPWLKDLSNQAKLLKWLGWDVAPSDSVHTGIVTGNRIFTGYRMGDHPVRQAHELINVVLRGEVKVGPTKAVKFWRGPQLDAVDLVDYLSGENIVRRQFEQLQPLERNFVLGEVTLSVRNYFMNLEHAAKDVIAAYGEPYEVTE